MQKGFAFWRALSYLAFLDKCIMTRLYSLQCAGSFFLPKFCILREMNPNTLNTAFSVLSSVGPLNGCEGTKKDPKYCFGPPYGLYIQFFDKDSQKCIKVPAG